MPKSIFIQIRKGNVAEFTTSNTKMTKKSHLRSIHTLSLLNYMKGTKNTPNKYSVSLEKLFFPIFSSHNRSCKFYIYISSEGGDERG